MPSEEALSLAPSLMYVLRMRMVHCILVVFLLFAGPGCASDPTVPDFPGHQAPETDVGGDVEGPTPPGFTGDRLGPTFHRLDCPAVSGIALRDQEHFENPWQALNKGYAPCSQCDPQAGWK